MSASTQAIHLAESPAYPTPATQYRAATRGLTKREVFAMAAMQGTVTSLTGVMLDAVNDIARERGITAEQVIAIKAVKLADALLEELAK